MGNARNNVIQDFKESKDGGLIDVKYFTGDLSDVTEDHFYEQANKMQIAISKGDAKEFSFNDSLIK
jgi:hypothetical protein